MPIYIKYGDIKGDVTAEGHKGSDGWVEISSFQWGVGRGIGSPTGGSDEREASAPSVSEITFSKTMDVSSYRWLEEALWGEGQGVTIDFCKTDKDKLEVYAKYTLENAMVSGYSVSSGGDRPTESISINFTKVVFDYTAMGAKNAGGDAPKTGYDIARPRRCDPDPRRPGGHPRRADVPDTCNADPSHPRWSTTWRLCASTLKSRSLRTRWTKRKTDKAPGSCWRTSRRTGCPDSRSGSGRPEPRATGSRE